MDKLGTLDWNHVRAFLITAEKGSLSAAARQLGLTQPTLSRQVSALEDSLGVLLFERLGRTLVLTGAGQELLAHGRAMGTAANALCLSASGQSSTIEGTVRITASDTLSLHLLGPTLHRLRKLAPGLTIDVIAANDIRDLMRREADIAIRHVRPEQPDLVARLIGTGRAHFYAAQSYIDRRGAPTSAEDLAAHDFVNFGDATPAATYAQRLNLKVRQEQFRIGSSCGPVAWEYVRQGFGIAPMYDRVAGMTPAIVRVMPWLDPLEFPFWLTTHRELHTSRRIRLVFDVLAEEVGKLCHKGQ